MALVIITAHVCHIKTASMTELALGHRVRLRSTSIALIGCLPHWHVWQLIDSIQLLNELLFGCVGLRSISCLRWPVEEGIYFFIH